MYAFQKRQENGTAKRRAEIWSPEARTAVTSQGESEKFALFYKTSVFEIGRYIYLGYFVCVCVCVTICVGTISYSFSFINQTDQGGETEGLKREGLKMER
jgi:hypothetical protein